MRSIPAEQPPPAARAARAAFGLSARRALWRGCRGSAPPAAAPRAAGFTLLEVLVAISLLSLIVTLAFTSFSQISLHSQALNQDLQVRQKLRLLLYVVREDLRGARYLSQFATGDRDTGLEGAQQNSGRDIFSWVNMHVVGEARLHRKVAEQLDPRVHEVGYGVKLQDRERFVLVRREQYYLDDRLGRGGIEQVMAGGVRVFRLEYLPLNASERTGWINSWNANTRNKDSRMPAAVRLVLGVEGEDGKVVEEQIEFNLEHTVLGPRPKS